MSFPGPPFDPELAEILKLPAFKPAEQEWTAEFILEQRRLMAPQCTFQQIEADPDLSHEELKVPGAGGEIILSVLRSKASTKEKNNPGIYNIHGGGMVFGNRFFGINSMFRIIKEIGAVLVSVEYRLAPENPAPAPLDDCYIGLQWMFTNATKLGIDPGHIIVAGGSSGGGLAAGIALLNRDQGGSRLFAQLLIYPMIDDRCNTASIKQFIDLGPITGNSSISAWNQYLPGIRGTDKVRIYDAPSRAQDLSNLPQAYIEVGASEPYRDESIAFASKLLEHGVQTELHVWPGAYHGYDMVMPDSAISKVSYDTRVRWLKRILATHL